MAISEPYLLFKDNCAEAMRFYQSVLGGKLDVMTYGDSPAKEHTPPGNDDKVIHARLELPGGGVIMASDDVMATNYQGMRGFYVSLGFLSVDEGKRVFDALSEGGTVNMPFGATFWSPGFGMLVDKFGTPIMVGSAPEK